MHPLRAHSNIYIIDLVKQRNIYNNSNCRMYAALIFQDHQSSHHSDSFEFHSTFKDGPTCYTAHEFELQSFVTHIGSFTHNIFTLTFKRLDTCAVKNFFICISLIRVKFGHFLFSSFTAGLFLFNANLARLLRRRINNLFYSLLLKPSLSVAPCALLAYCCPFSLHLAQS